MAETVGIFFSDPAMAAFLVLLSSIPHDERSAKKWKKKKVLGTIHILRQHMDYHYGILPHNNKLLDCSHIEI